MMECPKCGNQCEADFVDNGVGMQQCGPYVCLPPKGCGWIQPNPNDSVSQFAGDDGLTVENVENPARKPALPIKSVELFNSVYPPNEVDADAVAEVLAHWQYEYFCNTFTEALFSRLFFNGTPLKLQPNQRVHVVITLETMLETMDE